MRILIAGCGYVGSALGLLLTAEGHTVFGLCRDTKALPSAIIPISVDLSTPLPPDALPPNLDAVVHAVSPDDSTDEAYKLAYADGPRNLITALEPQENLRRFIFVSSTGVYGQKGGEWVDEESPAGPETTSGKRLLEGERLVLDGPFPATVLRPGGTYGPDRTGAIERALHGAPGEEDPPRYTNRIHRDDCAGALRHHILLPDLDPIYLGVDHEPATLSTVAKWLTTRPGKAIPPEANASRNSPRARTNKRCRRATGQERLLDIGEGGI